MEFRVKKAIHAVLQGMGTTAGIARDNMSGSTCGRVCSGQQDKVGDVSGSRGPQQVQDHSSKLFECLRTKCKTGVKSRISFGIRHLPQKKEFSRRTDSCPFPGSQTGSKMRPPPAGHVGPTNTGVSPMLPFERRLSGGNPSQL